MTDNRRSRRWLAFAGTGAVFAAVLALLWLQPAEQSPRADAARPADDKPQKADRAWPLFGGSVARNFVNLTDRNPPTDWDVAKGTNVRWSVELGSKAYGGPIFSGGKIFIGTNNETPRDPKIE